MRKIITMQDSFSLLESPKALEILTALAKNKDKLRITEIMEIVGGSARTSMVRVGELRDAGLIHDKKDKSFPFNRYLSLTTDGKAIGKRLLEIEHILQPKTGRKRGRPSSRAERIELPDVPGVVVLDKVKMKRRRSRTSKKK